MMSYYSLSTAPSYIWSCYVEYLWNYKPSSAVANIAYTFRVLAVLLILPILILTLLDIASYGIARTLGVIDDVKASTSDKQTIHTTVDAPDIHVHGPRLEYSGSADSDNAVNKTYFDSSQSSLTSLTPGPHADALTVSPPEYFTSEENSLKLSGVGVFSPASSRPPSPTLSRRQLYPESKFSLHEVETDEGLHFRKRTKQGGEHDAQ